LFCTTCRADTLTCMSARLQFSFSHLVLHLPPACCMLIGLKSPLALVTKVEQAVHCLLDWIQLQLLHLLCHGTNTWHHALMRYSHDLPTFCFVAAHQVVHSGEGSLLGIANCCRYLYSSPCLLLGSHFWLWHIRYHSLTLLLFLAYQVPFMHPNGHCHCPCHVSL